jgi:hypothetical protein
VVILFPATDDLLAETAGLVASYLYDVGIEAATDYAKEGEMEGMIGERVKAGEVVLSLTR